MKLIKLKNIKVIFVKNQKLKKVAKHQLSVTPQFPVMKFKWEIFK